MDLMGYKGYVGMRITCRGMRDRGDMRDMRDCGDMRDMRDGPPPRNRAVGSAVFLDRPPNPQRAEKGNGKQPANQKRNAYFSFNLLIINDINQYFNIHLYLISFIIYNR